METVLFFDGLTDSETYLLFEGLQYGYLDENGVFISKPEHGTECVTVGVCAYEEDAPETEITLTLKKTERPMTSASTMAATVIS